MKNDVAGPLAALNIHDEAMGIIAYPAQISLIVVGELFHLVSPQVSHPKHYHIWMTVIYFIFGTSTPYFQGCVINETFDAELAAELRPVRTLGCCG